MCMCPCEPACICAHTYCCLCLCSCFFYLFFRVCVSVPQYQILLSRLLATLCLVVICLSPLNRQLLLLFHFLFLPEFFISVPLFSVPLVISLFLFFLAASMSFFQFFGHLTTSERFQALIFNYYSLYVGSLRWLQCLK